MKAYLFLIPGFILLSCSSKCPCSSEELEVFRQELENHHLRIVEKDEVTCKKVDEFWRVSWEPISKQVPVHWDLFFDKQAMNPADGITDLNIKNKHFKQLKPLLRKARRNGYDFASVASRGWNKISIQILDSGKSFYVTQTYKFEQGDWVFYKTTKTWNPEGDSLDLTKLP